MSKKITENSSVNLYKIGNFNKNAIESFENNIVTQHNYLEKVHNTLNNNSSK